MHAAGDDRIGMCSLEERKPFLLNMEILLHVDSEYLKQAQHWLFTVLINQYQVRFLAFFSWTASWPTPPLTLFTTVRKKWTLMLCLTHITQTLLYLSFKRIWNLESHGHDFWIAKIDVDSFFFFRVPPCSFIERRQTPLRPISPNNQRQTT